MKSPDLGLSVVDPDQKAPDLGDLVIVLLAGTLAGLRDRLEDDGSLARRCRLAGGGRVGSEVSDGLLETIRQGRAGAPT
jgi:hypothetical protein